jgi:hypothetical protein
MLGQNEDLLSSLGLDALDGFFADCGMDDGPDEFAPRFARVKQYRAPKTVKYDFALEAARDIGLLEEGDRVEMIVSGNFIAGDFIEAYLEAHNLVVDEILLATLSLSAENVDSLVNVKQRLTGLMGLIVSDYFFAYERKQGIEDIIKNLAGDDFVLAVAGVHTKITLIRTECGRHLVLGGSANLRSSINIEQISMDNNCQLYAFHREWMAKILNNYHVHHKMLRRDNLWRLLMNQEAKSAEPATPGADSARRN